MKKTSLHDGHRDRLREKFIRHGLSSLEPHEVVELMLYAAVPRKDMNPLAHELLEGFGSFPALLDAPIEELMKYKGIGRGSAITIKLFSAIGRFYIESKADKGPTSMEEVIDIILSKFTGRSNEAVVLTLLDGKGKVLYCGVVTEGTAMCISEESLDWQPAMMLLRRFSLIIIPAVLRCPLEQICKPLLG